MTDHNRNTDVVRIPTATVDISHDHIRTTLPCGGELVAKQRAAEADRQRAESLGYSDAWYMHRDHDLAHSLLAAWVGLPASPVLQGIAQGAPLTKAESGAEEQAVLAIQRFCQQHGIDLVDVAARLGRGARLEHDNG